MGKNADAHKLLESKAATTSTWQYRGKVFSVRQDLIQTPQETYTRDVVITPGAVAIIPLIHDKIVLVQQWRRAIGKTTLEIPAGMLDKAGEKPIDCAHRELREETGYEARSLEPFGECYSSPGMFNEHLFLFLATDLIKRPLKGDDTHLIDVQEVTLSDACTMIEKGEILDAKTILGILRVKNR